MLRGLWIVRILLFGPFEKLTSVESVYLALVQGNLWNPIQIFGVERWLTSY